MGLEDLVGKEKNKDFNQEIREEIKTAYLEFQSFYDEILERSYRNPGILTEASSAWKVMDHLASELRTIHTMINAYSQDGMPIEEVKNLISISQRAMNKAQGFYHGEYNLLDKDGNWLENPEHIKK